MDSPNNKSVKEYSPPYQSRIEFTYDDLLDFPDDGKHYEIIDGELFMSPSPLTWHQRALGNLYFIFRKFAKENNLCEVFMSPYDVILSESDVVQPDIVVVLDTNSHIITRENIKGVPDFLIEILSPSNRKYDVKKKRALYERYGVKEYWLVDPDLENIQKFVLQEGKYIDCGIFEEEALVSSDVIKGLTFPVKEVFTQ